MNTKQIAEEAADQVRSAFGRPWGLTTLTREQDPIVIIIQSAIEKAYDAGYASGFNNGELAANSLAERAAHTSELQFDPNFQIPPEIMEAAYTVHNYAIRSGFGKGWCIGPVCDRDAHASDNQ